MATSAGARTLSVMSSTFSANTATADGNAIDTADDSGTGTVSVAADMFTTSCNKTPARGPTAATT